MPRFDVQVTRSETFTVTVDAEDRSEARDLAVEMVCESEDPHKDFPDNWSNGFEATGCEVARA